MITIEFSKKLVISSKSIPKKNWNSKTNSYETLFDDNMKPILVVESRIKMPMSSIYRGFIFTTYEQLLSPTKIGYDKNLKKNIVLGISDTLLSVKIPENATYKLTRTPYVLSQDGKPIVENGKYVLDFKKQEHIEISGQELKSEMDSWKKKNLSNPFTAHTEQDYSIYKTLMQSIKKDIKSNGHISDETQKSIHAAGFHIVDGLLEKKSV